MENKLTYVFEHDFICSKLWEILVLIIVFICGNVTAQTIIDVPSDYSNITDALNAASNGDTILVAPGTYQETIVIPNKSLVLASRFVETEDTSYIYQTKLDGGGGTRVIDIPSSVVSLPTIIGFTIQNANDGIYPQAKFNILNCRVINTSDGIDYEGGSGGLCKFNIFENNSDDGIDLDRDVEIVIEDNIIRNNNDDGIEIRTQPYVGPTINVIIRNNKIYGNGEDGIQFIDYNTVSDRLFIIERNLFINNAMVGVGCMSGSNTLENYEGASTPIRMYLFNNTFIGNNYGVTGGDSLVSVNNIFIDHPGIAMKNVDGGSIISYSIYWNNGTDFENSNVDNSNILYSNPDLDSQFQLLESSPAIDAGTASFSWQGETVLDLPSNGYNGTAPDLGVFESISELISLSINDAAVTEGNNGTVNIDFIISLSGASGQTVTVDYTTVDGTATAGIDYEAVSDELTFDPGETIQPVTIVVNSDILDELNETFFINLSNADGAAIADYQGQGTIYDDDNAGGGTGEFTVSFQEGVDGYSGTRDTKLLSGSPDSNYGSANTLEIDGSPQSSALLYWDVSSIPIGNIIESVSITVNITDGTVSNYEIYESKRAWVEDEATWNEYASGQSWEVPGSEGSSDRGTIELGSVTGSTGEQTISLNPAGVAVVQSWVNNPSSNRGIIITDYNHSNGLNISSREAGTVTDRPKLTVNYNGPALNLSSPNGGESWEEGSLQNITWGSVNTSGTVKIEFSADNGLSWSEIFDSTDDDGTESWTVPDTSTTEALIRISDMDGNGPIDTSDAVFTITPTPSITVTSPNGGESWEGGSFQNITWNSVNTSGTVKIEYSVDNGVTWSDITVSTPDTGSYPWTIPDTATTIALIAISDSDGNGPMDTCDVEFTIIPTPTLTIVTPNGGEIWEVDSTQNITWNSEGTSGTVKLEYSADNGISWSDITVSTPDTGSYHWTIPDSSTGTALVRISDSDGNGPVDTSDVAFTITSTPTLIVVTPNGGESWEGGSIQNVTWNSLGTSGTVKLAYSADNGASWSDITLSTPDTGSYQWTVPDTSTTTTLISISDTGGNSAMDTSDVVFTITPTPVVTVTSPNGGESWEGGSIQNITWNSVGTSGTVKIEYSADNGLTWSNIVASTNAGEGKEIWTVPDTSTTQAKVRISDFDGNGPVDTSDAVFTITPTPFITVTSPNGGESWEGRSIQNIAWNSVSTSGNVKIVYSADNGVNWNDITVSTPDTGSYPWIVIPVMQCLLLLQHLLLQ
jgi:hypothetical protein